MGGGGMGRVTHGRGELTLRVPHMMLVYGRCDHLKWNTISTRRSAASSCGANSAWEEELLNLVASKVWEQITRDLRDRVHRRIVFWLVTEERLGDLAPQPRKKCNSGCGHRWGIGLLCPQVDYGIKAEPC